LLCRRFLLLASVVAVGAVVLPLREAGAHIVSTTDGAGPAFFMDHSPMAPLSKPPEIVLTPLPPRPPLPPTLVEHGSRDDRRIALTFDACSTNDTSGYDGRITEVLVRTRTPATIFLGGKWMLRERQHVGELAAIPFLELGIHGYTHPHLATASRERITQELVQNEQVLYTLTGRRAQLFRPPYGEYDDRVLDVAGSMGLLTINFDAASGDPDPRATREKLLDWVPRIVKPGSIVVMHINGRGWHTAEVLEELIATLRHQNYELVTVSEWLERERNMEMACEPEPEPGPNAEELVCASPNSLPTSLPLPPPTSLPTSAPLSLASSPPLSLPLSLPPSPAPSSPLPPSLSLPMCLESVPLVASDPAATSDLESYVAPPVAEASSR
jgi:peptidoglycan-N-acetylglucosamine deacetylase